MFDPTHLIIFFNFQLLKNIKSLRPKLLTMRKGQDLTFQNKFMFQLNLKILCTWGYADVHTFLEFQKF